MVFDALFYWALAWYLSSIFKAEFGASKPWYFPITDTWEYFTKVTSSNREYDDEAIRTLYQPESNDTISGQFVEEVPANLKARGEAVRIRGLVKTFEVAGETKRAVDDLNLDIYRSEIFALLG